MPRLRASSVGAARSASSRLRHGILWACTAVAVLIGGATSALAQHGTRLEGDTSIMDGAMVGIVAMLVITFAMQGAFATFFFYLRRRAKRMADIDLETELSEVQRSPRRS
jgi:hypothetical protein